MKRFSRSMQGVTLLEIMLVLAVAAMIIVMSVRYYQSATSSQQVNSTLEQIQAISAAADGIAQGTNSYSTVTTSGVMPMMPNQSMATTWGTNITVAGTSATNYTVTIPGVPYAVCSQVVPKIQANNKFSTTSTCATGNANTITYTYNSQAGG
jgi:Tfp pilus assembly protein FimT